MRYGSCNCNCAAALPLQTQSTLYCWFANALSYVCNSVVRTAANKKLLKQKSQY